MTIFLQAGCGRCSRFIREEQKVDHLTGFEAQQAITRLDVVQRATVCRQIDDCAFFLSSTTASLGSDTVRSSWVSMFWQTAPASATQ